MININNIFTIFAPMFAIIIVTAIIKALFTNKKKKNSQIKWKEKKEQTLKEYKYENMYQDLRKNNPTYNQITDYEKERESAITKQKEFKKKLTNEEKKEKGDRYEKHVANVLREQGYYVWEHGKEKEFKDSGVDLLVKKNEYIYFVQCKDWENWKLDHNAVQAIQTKIRNFLKKEDGIRKLINNEYKQKILYITSKKCLTAGAYRYIEENSEILEYQVIPIEA